MVLITEQNIPTSYTQPDEPSEKQIGDVWVVTGDGGVEITLGKQPKITYSLLGAQQWDGGKWNRLDGYVWIEREWVKFSIKGILLKDIPVGTKINIQEATLPYGNVHILVAKNHQGHPGNSVCLVSEKIQAESKWADTTGPWSTSEIRNVLLGEAYLSQFPSKLVGLMMEVTNHFKYGTGQLGSSVDKLFIPSVKEATQGYPGYWNNENAYLFEYFSLNSAAATGKKDTYALRGVNGNDCAICTASGTQSTGSIVAWNLYGIRHCFCIPDSMMVSGSPNPDGSYNLIL